MTLDFPYLAFILLHLRLNSGSRAFVVPVKEIFRVLDVRHQEKRYRTHHYSDYYVRYKVNALGKYCYAVYRLLEYSRDPLTIG